MSLKCAVTANPKLEQNDRKKRKQLFQFYKFLKNGSDALTNLNTGTGYPCEGQNKTWGDSARASTDLLFSFPEVNLGATDPIGSEMSKNTK